jgi:hypothetical protein
MLRRMDVGMRHLELEPGDRISPETRGPRVAESSADSRPLARALGLVAVEESDLPRYEPRPRRRNRDGPLQDLRHVMIDGETEKRTDHRVVGAKWSESLAGADRETDGIVFAEEIVRGEDELVDVGVWMAAVHEPLAPVARGELAAAYGCPLEVEHPGEAQASPSTGVQRDYGLNNPQLAERTISWQVIRPIIRENGVRSCTGPDRGLGMRRHGGPNAKHQYEAEPAQSDSAPVADSGTSAARRKSRFIMVIVSMLICLGQAS